MPVIKTYKLKANGFTDLICIESDEFPVRLEIDKGDCYGYLCIGSDHFELSGDMFGGLLMREIEAECL